MRTAGLLTHHSSNPAHLLLLLLLGHLGGLAAHLTGTSQGAVHLTCSEQRQAARAQQWAAMQHLAPALRCTPFHHSQPAAPPPQHTEPPLERAGGGGGRRPARAAPDPCAAAVIHHACQSWPRPPAGAGPRRRATAWPAATASGPAPHPWLLRCVRQPARRHQEACARREGRLGGRLLLCCGTRARIWGPRPPLRRPPRSSEH